MLFVHDIAEIYRVWIWVFDTLFGILRLVLKLLDRLVHDTLQVLNYLVKQVRVTVWKADELEKWLHGFEKLEHIWPYLVNQDVTVARFKADALGLSKFFHVYFDEFGIIFEVLIRHLNHKCIDYIYN